MPEEHRGRGLAKAMLDFALRHPRLQGLRSWSLRTQDAHGLYARFGFKAIEHPETYMALHFENRYRRDR
jgi:GNAT superfamily N-acetyltransferase